MAGNNLSAISQLLRSDIQGHNSIFGKPESEIRVILEPLVSKHFHSNENIKRILKTEMHCVLGEDQYQCHHYGQLSSYLGAFHSAATKESKNVATSKLCTAEKTLLDVLSKKGEKSKNNSQQRELVLKGLVVMAKIASLLDEKQQQQQQQKEQEESTTPYNLIHPCTFQFIRFLWHHILFLGITTHNHRKTKNQYSYFLGLPEQDKVSTVHELQESSMLTLAEKLVGRGIMETPVKLAATRAKTLEKDNQTRNFADALPQSMDEFAGNNWAMEDYFWESEDCRIAQLDEKNRVSERLRLLELMITKCTGGKATVSDSTEGPPTVSPEAPLMNTGAGMDPSAEDNSQYQTAREHATTLGEEAEQFHTTRGHDPAASSRTIQGVNPAASSGTIQGVVASSSAFSSATTARTTNVQSAATPSSGNIGDGHVSKKRKLDTSNAIYMGTASADNVASLVSTVPTLTALLKELVEINRKDLSVPPEQLERIRKSMLGLEKACLDAGVETAPSDTSAVGSIAKELQVVLRELGVDDSVTKTNNGFGSIDGGLSLTTKGLMHSICALIKSGDCPEVLAGYDEYLTFNSNSNPQTDAENALAGCKYRPNDFYIVKKLGGGNFGTVLLVRHKEDPTIRAALKLASFDVLDFLKYGRRELVQGSRVKSRHVIRLLGFFPVPSVCPDAKPITIGFLLEECVHTLDPVIKDLNKKENDKMSKEELVKKVLRVCNVLLQLLTGVRDIHAAGLTHRDIKPGNVGLGWDGFWKLFDMGLCRELVAVAEMTVNAGSPKYIPPGGAGLLHDIFSCAVIMYQLMVGEFPSRNRKTLTIKQEVQVKTKFGFDAHPLLIGDDSSRDLGAELVDLYKKMNEPNDNKRMPAAKALQILEGIIASLKGLEQSV